MTTWITAVCRVKRSQLYRFCRGDNRNGPIHESARPIWAFCRRLHLQDVPDAREPGLFNLIETENDLIGSEWPGERLQSKVVRPSASSPTSAQTCVLMTSTSPTAESLKTTESQPVMFFDGVCGLCNHSVDFVLARDQKGVFLFSPLQGETARERLTENDRQQLGSLVLADAERLYRRSAAVVQILLKLGGAWKLLGALLWCVPKPLRDLAYRGVAANRYRLFGKKEFCRLPTPEEQARFLP